MLGQRKKIYWNAGALAGVAQWIEGWPANQRVACFPVRAHAWVVGQVPSRGAPEATTH